jgi:hypothetical protein
MPDPQPMTQDEAGVTRTLTGEISSPSTSTPGSDQPQETVVRPPPTPTTTQSIETKTDAKPPKSLINEESAPQGAPEKYSDFKVPEGFTLDQEAANDFGALAKKGNLSQAYAQELVDFYIKQQQQMNNAPAEHYEAKQQEWKDAISSDPEIGGSKWNDTRASIGRLFDSLGDASLTDAFRQAMDYTGAGNHPGVVKFLARIAQRLTEGGPVRGSGPSLDGMRRPGEGRPSAAQAIYPNLKSTYEQG